VPNYFLKVSSTCCDPVPGDYLRPVGPGRSRKSTRPGANYVVDLVPFKFLDRLADLVPPRRKYRQRYFSAPRDDTARAGCGNRAKSNFLLIQYQ
jgi:hypothetical protein